VFVDNVPVSREVGVGRRSLEDDGRYTKQERRIDDIGVTRDPANITTTEEDVLIVDVKDLFASGSSANQVTAGCVHDTLGFAGRA